MLVSSPGSLAKKIERLSAGLRGKTAVRGKIQTAVPVEPHVADSSAPEPGKLVEALDLTQEQAQAVSDAAKSVKAPDLAAAAGSEANSITKEEAKALVDQANITPAEGEKVTLYVQTFLDVQPKEYDPQTGVLKLEITPKYQIVASTAKTAEGILPNNSQTVQDPLPTEVSTTVTMSLTLPTEFVSGTPSIYVQHSKDGVTYVYDLSLIHIYGTPSHHRKGRWQNTFRSACILTD